jgi:hypothetical protein
MLPIRAWQHMQQPSSGCRCDSSCRCDASDMAVLSLGVVACWSCGGTDQGLLNVPVYDWLCVVQVMD